MLPGDGPDPVSSREDARRAEILKGLLGEFEPGRCVDLACGTGAFAVLAADMGWTVHAVDARQRDWPDHPRVTFTCQDVRDTEFIGADLVLCLGIFYHLDLRDQLALLRRCAGLPIILDTHVALSAEVTIHDADGRWYAEADSLLAAFGNSRSFWPTEASLRQMLARHGYGTVTAAEPWYHQPDRTFFTCLPA